MSRNKIGFANPASFRSPNVLGSGKRFTTGTLPFQDPSPTFEDPHQAFGLAPVPMEREKSDEDSYFDELERIRGASGPALQAYQKGLTEQPTYDAYKPSTGRKLGAALVGFGAGLKSGPVTGAGLGISVRDAPYNQARSDYEERMKGLGASAKLEQDEREASAKNLIAARNMGLEYKKYDASRTDADRAHGLAERKVGVDEGGLEVQQRNSDTTYQGMLNQGQYWKTTGKTGQDNARTAAWNAATNARNATTRENELEETSEYHDDTISVARERLLNDLNRSLIAAGRTTPANPREQMDAIDGALKELWTDPTMRQYIEEPDANGFLNPKINDKTPGYREFQRRVQEIAHRRLTTGLPFGPMPPAIGAKIEPGQ